MGPENKNIIRTPKFDYTPDSRGMGYIFYNHMLKNKDKLAQIYGPTGEEDTWGDLLQRSVRTAISMKKRGLTPGDYVSLCTFNHLDSATPIIASYFVGTITASVDPTLSLEDTVHLLKQVPPKLIFVIPEAVEMIETAIKIASLASKIVVFGGTTKHTPFSDFLQPDEEEVDFKPTEAKSLKDTAMIFFSSGTTGLPKGIHHSHYAMLCQNVNFANCGFCFDLTIAYASPYWTVFPMMLNACIITGTARLILAKFEPSEAWKIFDYKLTCALLNSLQILTMLKQGRPKNLSLSSLKQVVTGAGPIMLEQMVQIREMFHDTTVLIAYGQSEVPDLLTVFKPCNPRDLELISKKPTSVGTGFPGISYKVADPETEEILGPNRKGELRVKSEFVLTGYHNIDSSVVWDSEGWLKTGDLGYYDDDHCFYVVDRIKEMFKFQGWHIVPAVLESVILTHPAVEMAMVIGVPHDIDGEHPLGVVVLKPSRKDVTPQEIEKYVEERVQDRQRLRAGVKIIDMLPTTPSGKINRLRLKKMFHQGEI